uniref:Uncharacterized protein n=1 Tax=Salmo trutta TaxID=8032 RepID=A0A674F7T0_SALTR
ASSVDLFGQYANWSGSRFFSDDNLWDVKSQTYDALPGIGHVTVLGIPAEEEGGGKVDLILTGPFEDMGVVFMAHFTQQDVVFMAHFAQQDVVFIYHGKVSHAAAYPWDRFNALDAAVLAYDNWRFHGIIKHDGVKPNIISAYAELEYYLHTPLSCLRSFVDKIYVLAGSTDFGNVPFVVHGIHPFFYIGSDALNHALTLRYKLQAKFLMRHCTIEITCINYYENKILDITGNSRFRV